MTRHASPFHCPYCGEQDLYPREDGWECRACLRAFSVTFLGQLPRPVVSTTAAESTGADS